MVASVVALLYEIHFIITFCFYKAPFHVFQHLSFAAPRRLIFHDNLARVFLAAELRYLSVCSRCGALCVFATRHGRTNVVVMGVVVRHQRVATHRARVYLRARVHAREPTRDTRHASPIREFD